MGGIAQSSCMYLTALCRGEQDEELSWGLQSLNPCVPLHLQSPGSGREDTPVSWRQGHKIVLCDWLSCPHHGGKMGWVEPQDQALSWHAVLLDNMLLYAAMVILRCFSGGTEGGCLPTAEALCFFKHLNMQQPLKRCKCYVSPGSERSLCNGKDPLPTCHLPHFFLYLSP